MRRWLSVRVSLLPSSLLLFSPLNLLERNVNERRELLPTAAVFDFGGYYSEFSGHCRPARHASTVTGADERTGFVEREGRYVRAERVPGPLQPQILFDVGEVEHRDGGLALAQVRADGAQGLGAGEITHHRNDE